ncbi:MAG: hypothetical protein QM638_15925 [Nocardioides sp.]|uniref:hypothetical protein n=1 Tax=Nocardioides sp. TaxID=35761 RepID=UPI0039E35486
MSTTASATTRSHSAGPAIRAGIGRLGRWQVTAPHRQPRNLGPRAPWGVWHLRANGASRTCCGLPAATWFVFFERGIEPRDPHACPACLTAAGLDG